MEEYDICTENIGKARRLIEQKTAVVPTLKKALREASSKVKEAQKTIIRRDGIAALRAESAWAHIKAKEEVQFKQCPI